MIDVDSVTKRFGNSTAIRNVSFSAGRGEILGILGPNGAGKTTTMRILTGYLAPTVGRVSVMGYDMAEQPIEAKRCIGYLPEHAPLYQDMTINAYLAFVAALYDMTKNRRRARIEAVCDQTGLGSVIGRRIGTLSNGYRRRVGLAQALLHDPQLVVLDEPTAGLDPIQIHATRELIRSLGDSHTVILSSHILSEVSDICDRVLIMSSRGEVIANDRPENLSRHASGGGCVVSLDVRGPASDIARELGAITGVLRVQQALALAGTARFDITLANPEIRPEIAARIVRKGWDLLGMRRSSTELEDVFLHLVLEDERQAALHHPARYQA